MVNKCTSIYCIHVNLQLKNWVKSVCCGQIQHNFRCSEDLCKLGTEHLNSPICKLVLVSRQNSETF